mmetsp:Transcript_16587/g.47094  ORF Transcript_16587/g.47094 Transcript_16587/m.47094 type:complete len:203 (+) Transcript_16587:403-1011(+)
MPKGLEAGKPKPGFLVRPQDGQFLDLRCVRRSWPKRPRRIEFREREFAEADHPGPSIQDRRDACDVDGCLQEDTELGHHRRPHEEAQRADVRDHGHHVPPRPCEQQAHHGPCRRLHGRDRPRERRQERRRGHRAYARPQAELEGRAGQDRTGRGPRCFRRLREPPCVCEARALSGAQHVALPRGSHGPYRLWRLLRAGSFGA